MIAYVLHMYKKIKEKRIRIFTTKVKLMNLHMFASVCNLIFNKLMLVG